MEESRAASLRRQMIKRWICRHRWKMVAVSIFVIFLMILKLFVIDIVVVSGNSMEPTLTDGQILLVYKAAYWVESPENGDIVVVQHGTEQYTKRIAACPGEIPPGEKNTLPNGRYYILGDNQSVSIDSRSFGSVSEKLIIGRILK